MLLATVSTLSESAAMMSNGHARTVDHGNTFVATFPNENQARWFADDARHVCGVRSVRRNGARVTVNGK